MYFKQVVGKKGKGQKVKKIMNNTKYISPLTDWGFKKLFGKESSKGNLIHFLNAVFHEQGLPWIESLEIKNFKIKNKKILKIKT